MDANDYRGNQVCEWQSELKTVNDQYTLKVKKYGRRIVVLDVVVYSVPAVVASAGVILSTITPVTAVITATMCFCSYNYRGCFRYHRENDIHVCEHKGAQLHVEIKYSHGNISEIIIVDIIVGRMK